MVGHFYNHKFNLINITVSHLNDDIRANSVGLLKNEITMNNHIPDHKSKTNKSLISGKKLAQILDVSASSLSEAVKKGYNCGGYPVVEWAEFNRFGRVDGYDVPDFLLSEKPQDDETRPNPDTDAPYEDENQEKSQQSVVTNNYSLLPKGENYAHPVGIASLSMVLKQALGNDTPQTRAVIGGTLALLGAITAHSITDSGVAAGIGAGAGVGIAVYFYNNFNEFGNIQHINPPKQQTLAQPVGKPVNRSQVYSGYLVM